MNKIQFWLRAHANKNRLYFHARFMRGSCAQGWPTYTPQSLPPGTLKEDTKLNMIFKLLLSFINNSFRVFLQDTKAVNISIKPLFEPF